MVLDHEFPPDLRVENEMETLLSARYEVHLLCYTRTCKEQEEKHGNFIIHRRPVNSFIYKSSVGAITFPFYFNFWRKFLNNILSGQYFDVLHIHDLPLIKVGVEIKNKYKIPLISDLHENWPAYLRIAEHTKSILGRILSPERKWIEYEKTHLLLADQIIVVVDEAKDRLIKLGIDPERIHIVSNTLNIKNFKPRETDTQNDEIIMFYAGGLNYHRGLQVVLYAFEKIKETKPGIKLWVLGKGSYKNELIHLSKKLGLEEMVTFLGWQPYHKMIEKLMMTDYTLIPHIKSEHTDSTIPHKLFQYMYARKPVIATDCLPIQRIINETKSGYIYVSDDFNALAKILSDLDKKKDKVMGENGHKWVKNKYNWEFDSQVLLDLYRKIEKKTKN
jgi:glycosyltransferase involved in cell wall biosynthesis